jgi:hypothetical protein
LDVDLISIAPSKFHHFGQGRGDHNPHRVTMLRRREHEKPQTPPRPFTESVVGQIERMSDCGTAANGENQHIVDLRKRSPSRRLKLVTTHGDNIVAMAARASAAWNFIFKVNYEEALSIGFLERDAVALSSIGLPQFSAPHIYLEPPCYSTTDHLILGFDEDENRILYYKTDGHVSCLLGDGRRQYVSPGITEFVSCLLALSEPVDHAIEIVGHDVFEKGPFPKKLVSDFSKRIDELVGAHTAQTSFWTTEINRMFALGSQEGA